MIPKLSKAKARANTSKRAHSAPHNIGNPTDDGRRPDSSGGVTTRAPPPRTHARHVRREPPRGTARDQPRRRLRVGQVVAADAPPRGAAGAPPAGGGQGQIERRPVPVPPAGVARRAGPAGRRRDAGRALSSGGSDAHPTAATSSRLSPDQRSLPFALPLSVRPPPPASSPPTPPPKKGDGEGAKEAPPSGL